MAFDVFEIDTDGVAPELGDPDVGDNRTRSHVVALAEERGDAGVDDVRRARLRLVGIGLGGEHLGPAVAPDGGCVGKELTSGVELLLSEAEDSVEQAVELVVRLGGGAVSPIRGGARASILHEVAGDIPHTLGHEGRGRRRDRKEAP